jgi:hypothetical protein
VTLSAFFLPSKRPNVTLADELGHACNLFHLTDPSNLVDVTTPGPARLDAPLLAGTAHPRLTTPQLV